MRLTLKAINDELRKRGHNARLEEAGDYFYFHLGEAADWLDKTVRVSTVSSLTLDEWMAEFEKLRKLNSQIMGKSGKPRAKGKRMKANQQ